MTQRTDDEARWTISENERRLEAELAAVTARLELAMMVVNAAIDLYEFNSPGTRLNLCECVRAWKERK